MKRTLLALLILGSTASADRLVDDNDVSATVDCAAEKVVNITGNNAEIKLTGTCDMLNISGNEAKITGSVKKIQISGNDNKLTLEATDSILVSGNTNTLTYKKTVKAKKVGVLNSGNGNKIGKAK